MYTQHAHTVKCTHKQSYTCELKKLPPEISDYFVQLHSDEETKAFLKECRRKSSNVCLQFLYSFVQMIFGLFLSKTAINGYGYVCMHTLLKTCVGCLVNDEHIDFSDITLVILCNSFDVRYTCMTLCYAILYILVSLY